jgi:O-antigen/teichoic acid export membrane protein
MITLFARYYLQIEALLFSNKGQSTRTGKIAQNVLSSGAFKFLSILISFLMVPVTLDYLDKARYGLWAALSSVLAWFFIFDIGIGNGLRNKFTELKAKGLNDEIKYYISTTYFLFSIMAVLIILIFIFINHFLSQIQNCIII